MSSKSLAIFVGFLFILFVFGLVIYFIYFYHSGGGGGGGGGGGKTTNNSITQLWWNSGPAQSFTSQTGNYFMGWGTAQYQNVNQGSILISTAGTIVNFIIQSSGYSGTTPIPVNLLLNGNSIYQGTITNTTAVTSTLTQTVNAGDLIAVQFTPSDPTFGGNTFYAGVSIQSTNTNSS